MAQRSVSHDEVVLQTIDRIPYGCAVVSRQSERQQGESIFVPQQGIVVETIGQQPHRFVLVKPRRRWRRLVLARTDLLALVNQSVGR